MLTAFYEYLIHNNVGQLTAQNAVEQVRRRLGMQAPLSRNAARLVRDAQRHALSRLPAGNPFEVHRDFREQAIVLPGEDVTDEDEGEEYVATRPSPFLRTGPNARAIIDDNGAPTALWWRPLSTPEIQMLALTVAAGM
jgi:hypothetical protein